MKVILQCEHKSVSECKDCPISILNKYPALLCFVKSISYQEMTEQELIDYGFYTDEVLQARAILKELGEHA